MNLKITDQEVRESILKSGVQNTLVSASAGAGKTTILINKIKSVIEAEQSHRTVAAITFTIKATNEIKERLRNNNFHKEVVVYTNDAFVENEIIRPFIRDTVFGKEMKKDFTVEYNNSISTYEEGLRVLKEQNILSSYKSYIKKNFKFELAKKILEQSKAARQYIESKYVMLFLDEYQDSDLEMHSLFMYMKNVVGISLFIVGDEKQAIYLWRGAQSDIFHRLDAEGFSKYILTRNFRCDPEINNFANFVHQYESFRETDKDVTKMTLCKTELSIEETVDRLVKDEHLNITEEITLLINTNATAQAFAHKLKQKGYDFVFIPRTPIDDGLLNTYFLKQVAKLYFNDHYSIYDFCEALNIETSSKNINKYEMIFEVFIEKEELDFTKIEKAFVDFEEESEYSIDKEEILKLLETISNEDYKICFLQDIFKYKIMTVFGSKGLEFDQVVAISSDYNLKNENKLNAHYVAVTRARKKMILIDNTILYSKELRSVFLSRGIKTEVQRKKVLEVIDYIQN